MIPELRWVRVKHPTRCAETKNPIRKGDLAIWQPARKRLFSTESLTAQALWDADKKMLAAASKF